MARRLSWSDVRGGLIAITAIAVLAFVILKYMRVGNLRGDTIRLYTLVGEARGILVGSEVWLSGQKIGKVTDIRFRPPAVADTTHRLEIKMLVLAQYRPDIHRDAEAQVRNGGTIIGSPVVYMTPGTLKAPEIRDGDTVRAKPQPDVESAGAQFSVAAREVSVIMSNMKVLSAQLQTTKGTVGAFLHTPEASSSAELARARERSSRLVADLAHGSGTVGRLLDGGLSERISLVLSRADSVRALLASAGPSFGRLRRDSTLLLEVADIRKELANIQALVDEPRGTVGRVQRDSAITKGLAEARRQMSLLVADMKRHPLRYIKF